MKVILLQELKGRGGEGDVIEVARGFAVNYLLPRKVAIEATSGNLKQLEQRAHNIKAREDLRLTDATALFERLNEKSVRIEAKVGEEGRLFGSVTSSHIEAAIVEQIGVTIDRRKIETHGSIKDVGPHTINIAIYRDVKAELTVDVVAEGAPVVEETVAEAEVVAEDAAVEQTEASTEAEDAATEVAEESADAPEAEVAEEVAE
jgi:large subunit ribosomal protein L9